MVEGAELVHNKREQRATTKKLFSRFLVVVPAPFAQKKDRQELQKSERWRQQTKKGGDGTTSKNEEREGQPQEEIGEQNHRKKKGTPTRREREIGNHHETDREKLSTMERL